MSRGARRRSWSRARAGWLPGDCGRSGPQQALGGPTGGCGKHVRRTTRISVVGCLPAAHGDRHRLPADWLRWRDSGDHEPDSRLRCLGCSVVARPVRRLQGLSPDSVGARRYGCSRQCQDECDTLRSRSPGLCSRTSISEPSRNGTTRTQEAQSGRHASDTKTLRPSIARTGPGTSYNFTDYLSSVEPDLEVEDRIFHTADLSRRESAGGDRPASRASSRTPKVRSATRTSPTRLRTTSR